jgi:hypothetical protein
MLHQIESQPRQPATPIEVNQAALLWRSLRCMRPASSPSDIASAALRSQVGIEATRLQQAYLTDVLTRLPTTLNKDIDQLLSMNWGPAVAAGWRLSTGCQEPGLSGGYSSTKYLYEGFGSRYSGFLSSIMIGTAPGISK